MATLSAQPVVQQTLARPSRRWLLGATALIGVSSLVSWEAALRYATMGRASASAPAAPADEPAFTVYLVGSAEQGDLVRRAIGNGPTTDVLLADTPVAMATAQRAIKDIRLGMADQPVKVVDLTRP